MLICIPHFNYKYAVNFISKYNIYFKIYDVLLLVKEGAC